jgi:citrate lyase subunit beta/citryl-CoA lyase
MLALRSILLIDARDEGRLRAARSSSADAIAIDLAAPHLASDRPEARRLAKLHIAAIHGTGRPVYVRVSDTRSGHLEADLDAVVSESVAAVILPAVEQPQDTRDVDVTIRRHEMERGLTPGSILVLPEVDSAEGVLALPRILAAIDRCAGVLLTLDGLQHDMHLGGRANAIFDHAMADVAFAAHMARIPWVLAGGDASTAHDYGAAGVLIDGEAEARGVNSLFTPDRAEVAAARVTLDAWERLLAAGQLSAEVDGRIVDRRAARRARGLLELADAIERRERVR